MKSTIRLFILMLLAALLHSSIALAQRQVLRVGIYDFLPLNKMNSDGTVQGIYPEVLNDIAAREGWELVWVKGTWPQCIERLKKGAIDLLVGISRNKERERYFSYNNEHMLITWGRVYTPPGKPIKALFDLRLRTVAVLKDDYYNQKLRHMLDGFGIVCRYLEVDEAGDAFKAVYQGKADAVGSERFNAWRHVKKFNFEESPIIYGPGEFLFASPKGRHSDILLAIDRRLKALKADPSSVYHQSLAQWLEGAERLVPSWVNWAFIAASGLLFLFVLASLVLRQQVKARTKELTASNEQLRFEVAERTQTQDALAANEERLRSIFNSAALGIALVDRNDRYSQINSTWEAILGYEPGELRWASYQKVIHPDEREQSRESVAKLRSGGVDHYRAERRYIKKNGEVIWVEVGVSRLDLAREGEADTLGVMVDITERKRAEQLLRQSEERLRAVFNTTTLGIALVGADGCFTQVNPALAAMLGYTAEQAAGMRVADVVFTEDRAEVLERWEALLHGVEGFELEARFMHADGRRFLGAVSINKIKSPDRGAESTLWIIADVTESRKAQKALEESERRYRQLFDSIGDLIFTHDLKGTFITMNRAAATLLGREPSQVVGKNIRDFVFPRDLDRVGETYLEKLTQGETISGISRYRNVDGSKRYIEYTSTLVLEEGKEPFASCSGRDVTERVMAERELRQLEEQLLHSQKMEAVGTLASGIAHDFNNILQAISGYVQLMALKGPVEDGEGDYLGQILLSVERASQLVQRLLAFGRKMASTPAPTDLNQVITDTVKVLEVALPKMIEIKTDLQPDLAAIHADRNQLFQVLMNLGGNADDAMEHEGRLEIKTREVALDPEFCRGHVGLKPGRHVMLEVADTGKGMDEEVLAHIFDPFFTTKGVGEGSGLGLSTVYGIVKGHKGYIGCESRPGQGTTFTVYFPAMDAEVLPDGQSRPTGDRLAEGRETVLLVDDEESVLEVGSTILAEHGYKVLTATRGEEALDVYRDLSGEIDLVVLDLNMPGMGGARCLAEILEISPSAKVIVASGYSEKMNQHNSALRGAAAYLSKPYSLSQLLKFIREILDRKS